MSGYIAKSLASLYVKMSCKTVKQKSTFKRLLKISCKGTIPTDARVCCSRVTVQSTEIMDSYFILKGLTDDKTFGHVTLEWPLWLDFALLKYVKEYIWKKTPLVQLCNVWLTIPRNEDACHRTNKRSLASPIFINVQDVQSFAKFAKFPSQR